MGLVRKGDARTGSTEHRRLTPERRAQIARFGVQVVLVAILADLMNGTVSGELV